MNLISYPVSSLNGEITVPGDKSISHRALIFGSIAIGQTTIENFLNAEDCLATMKIFRAMGVAIDDSTPGKIYIEGVGKYGLQKPKQVLDCGNSGTSIRLLAGLLSGQKFDTELTGDKSLQARPMARIAKPLLQMGADIQTCDNKPPLKIFGSKNLKGIEYKMPVASAQVKSCVLLAGLYASGETSIIETGVSRNHTELMLASFSYPIYSEGSKLVISSNAECIGTDIKIPGDLSSAAFFIVAATITPGSQIRISNVGINPTRIGIIEILTAMGANISVENKRLYNNEPVADLTVTSAKLSGIEIPPSMVPLAIDEFPIIFIAAAIASGKTTLRGAEELRAKESDRLAAMVKGLETLGISVQAYEDGLCINGGQIQGGVIDSFGDHRIAMAFAIAGAVALKSITIKACENIATSFPNFVKTAKALNLAIEDSSNDV